jgi:MoaA/NifB/PqqE/SkfB family radical SAM enzyme
MTIGSKGRDLSACFEALERRSIHAEYPPPVIYVETVKGCPHSCAMCHFRNTPVKRAPWSLIERLEPSFPSLAVLAIHGQGEPLLGDVGYFVGKAIEHDLVLHMNTSGILLTPRLADLLSEARLSIRFSIHAGSAETYRRIMGHDPEKVTRNITYLTRRSEEAGARNDFWFSFLVMKENIDEVEDFLRLAHDCGIRSVRFMRLIPNWMSLLRARPKDRDFRFSYREQFNRGVLETFGSRIPEQSWRRAPQRTMKVFG